MLLNNRKRYERSKEDSMKAVKWRSERRDDNDLKALFELSPEGILIWEYAVNEYNNYTSVISINSPGYFEFYQTQEQEPKRRVIGPNESCNCNHYIKNCAICPHQLLYDKGVFLKHKFSKQFHKH